MDDCSICTDIFFEHDFINLECCSNKLCSRCLNSLLVPLCPFCRKKIESITDDPKYKLSVSYDSSHLTQSTIQSILIPSNNNLLPSNNIFSSSDQSESRILRRQINRQRKLESRELDKRRNRELSRSRRRNELQQIINEEQDIFFYEF